MASRRNTAKINGRELAYEITGSGGINDIGVILETGLGAESAEWAPVVAGLVEHTDRARVLTYDRAGRGDSAPLDGAPRGVGDLLDDLNALLDASRFEPPYVMVGHSFGGVLARAFARQRGADLRGLVLAESMHPLQFERLGPLFPAPHDDDAPALVHMRAFWQHAWRRPDATPEHLDFARALADDVTRSGSLGALPVRVLHAAAFATMPFIADEPVRHALQAQWDALQHEFLALSSATEAVFLEQSGHFVQRDQPDAIVRAVLDLIA